MSDISANLQELSEPSERGEKIQFIIDRAAKAAGLGYSRAYEIWYGRAKRVSDEERVRVAEALEKKRKVAAANELNELRTRITRLESLLVQIDPDFHRSSLDACRHQVRAMDGNGGAVHRAVAAKVKR